MKKLLATQILAALLLAPLSFAEIHEFKSADGARTIRAELDAYDMKTGIATLTLSRPERLNSWTGRMHTEYRWILEQAERDDGVRVVVITGEGRGFCAGADTAALETHIERGGYDPGTPDDLPEPGYGIRPEFDADFAFQFGLTKPVIAAINGPAIGASVTSATLCDGIIASERATFSTPFAKLGVPPEGCSSVMFERILGAAGQRMLGEEGWKPTAAEALEAGLVQWVVPHGDLMTEAKRIAQAWVAEGAARSFRGGADRAELNAVNARESVQVASAFLSPRFLTGQFRCLWRKKKRTNALMFLALRMSHPMWSRLL